MFNRFFYRTLVFKSQVTQIDQMVRNVSTIYALSTSLSNKGVAIAVIRISGDATLNGLSLLIGNKSYRKLETNPRKAILADIIHPGSSELIDKGLVFWFPKPNSYTGEDAAELHVHGSRAVVSLLLRTLGEITDFKPAEEGEFTRRAFMNGKLNLIEAEGLSSLISSRTDSQRRLAMQALDGNANKLYTQWRQSLLKSIAHLEAIINFSEDEMIDETILDKVQEEMVKLKESIMKFLDEASRRSELIKGGVNMAIIGLPNVGKSTLLNKLCRRDLSIVSPISGTTRDIVEGYLDIKGWSIRVSDTAGLKDTCIQDPIELEGIKRAKQRAVEADLVLLVMDGSCLLLDSDKTNFTQCTQNFEDILSSEKRVIYIINKVDLLNESEINRLKSLIPAENSSLVSCKTEQSLDELIEIIGNNISSLCGNVQNEQIFITDRHQTHLKKICEALESCMQYFGHDLALAGFYLRQCVDEIASITGKISTEDILDIIFKDFCIGK